MRGKRREGRQRESEVGSTAAVRERKMLGSDKGEEEGVAWPGVAWLPGTPHAQPQHDTDIC